MGKPYRCGVCSACTAAKARVWTRRGRLPACRPERGQRRECRSRGARPIPPPAPAVPTDGRRARARRPGSRRSSVRARGPGRSRCPDNPSRYTSKVSPLFQSGKATRNSLRPRIRHAREKPGGSRDHPKPTASSNASPWCEAYASSLVGTQRGRHSLHAPGHKTHPFSALARSGRRTINDRVGGQTYGLSSMPKPGRVRSERKRRMPSSSCASSRSAA